jgi:hypothetical protein
VDLRNLEACVMRNTGRACAAQLCIIEQAPHI